MRGAVERGPTSTRARAQRAHPLSLSSLRLLSASCASNSRASTSSSSPTPSSPSRPSSSPMRAGGRDLRDEARTPPARACHQRGEGALVGRGKGALVGRGRASSACRARHRNAAASDVGRHHHRPRPCRRHRPHLPGLPFCRWNAREMVRASFRSRLAALVITNDRKDCINCIFRATRNDRIENASSTFYAIAVPKSSPGVSSQTPT